MTFRLFFMFLLLPLQFFNFYFTAKNSKQRPKLSIEPNILILFKEGDKMSLLINTILFNYGTNTELEKLSFMTS